MSGATVSFDNLGEIADLGRGLWDEAAPLGEHPSVTRALPRVRALLREHGVRATFFVEGRNAELYPDELGELAAEGHEVALHGWCHEPWADLDRDREAALLERGRDAMARIGVPVHGFRPPGGRLSAASPALLREAGLAYCSPAGSGSGRLDGVAVLPFRWELVDAVYALPRFAALRGSPEPRPPDALLAAVRAAEDRHLSVLFHPFLLDAPERLAVLDAVLRHLGAAAVPYAEVDRVGDDLRLDLRPA